MRTRLLSLVVCDPNGTDLNGKLLNGRRPPTR